MTDTIAVITCNRQGDGNVIVVKIWIENQEFNDVCGGGVIRLRRVPMMQHPASIHEATILDDHFTTEDLD